MSNDDDLERRPLLGVREDDAAAEMTASREEPRTMPWAGLGTIYFVNLVPGMAFLMISPFVNQMLLENGVVKKPEDAGYYSGFIESLFAVVQVRRPVTWVIHRAVIYVLRFY
ncbi:hypothetical protein BKA62DRAFT_776863 [Auriculariales sp. MPI-PUGE-AT-0066]|nr:hypothetical protein BKA62DRAFT_776863 [Auriculariales sp. MPI-PUGE-AT-0066]